LGAGGWNRSPRRQICHSYTVTKSTLLTSTSLHNCVRSCAELGNAATEIEPPARLRSTEVIVVALRDLPVNGAPADSMVARSGEHAPRRIPRRLLMISDTRQEVRWPRRRRALPRIPRSVAAPTLLIASNRIAPTNEHARHLLRGGSSVPNFHGSMPNERPQAMLPCTRRAVVLGVGI
jgi:hypothetical protein